MDWIPKKKQEALPDSIRESVERAREKAPPPPRPDPVPVYLGCVYRQVMLWRQSDQWKEIKKDVKSYYKKYFHKTIRKDYFRFLIALSSSSHVSPQEISKYVDVLNYARLCKIPPNDFRKFLKKNGGIKGCIKAKNKATGKPAAKNKIKRKPAAKHKVRRKTATPRKPISK
jgi:hypothetical protein